MMGGGPASPRRSVARSVVGPDGERFTILSVSRVDNHSAFRCAAILNTAAALLGTPRDGSHLPVRPGLAELEANDARAFAEEFQAVVESAAASHAPVTESANVLVTAIATKLRRQLTLWEAVQPQSATEEATAVRTVAICKPRRMTQEPAHVLMSVAAIQTSVVHFDLLIAVSGGPDSVDSKADGKGDSKADSKADAWTIVDRERDCKPADEKASGGLAPNALSDFKARETTNATAAAGTATAGQPWATAARGTSGGALSTAALPTAVPLNSSASKAAAPPASAAAFAASNPVNQWIAQVCDILGLHTDLNTIAKHAHAVPTVPAEFWLAAVGVPPTEREAALREAAKRYDPNTLRVVLRSSSFVSVRELRHELRRATGAERAKLCARFASTARRFVFAERFGINTEHPDEVKRSVVLKPTAVSEVTMSGAATAPPRTFAELFPARVAMKDDIPKATGDTTVDPLENWTANIHGQYDSFGFLAPPGTEGSDAKRGVPLQLSTKFVFSGVIAPDGVLYSVEQLIAIDWKSRHAEENQNALNRKRKHTGGDDPDLERRHSEAMETLYREQLGEWNKTWLFVHQFLDRRLRIPLQHRVLTRAKKQFQAIRPSADPKIMRDLNRFLGAFVTNVSPMRGLLLWGPPGAGKTTIFKDLIAYCGFNAIVVRDGVPAILGSSDTLRSVVGSSETLMRLLLSRAARTPYLPCILIVDEVEGIVPSRADAKGDSPTIGVVNTVLNYFCGGGDRTENLFIVAATNFRARIDEAVARRLEATVFVGLLTPEARVEFFKECVQIPPAVIREVTMSFTVSQLCTLKKLLLVQIWLREATFVDPDEAEPHPPASVAPAMTALLPQPFSSPPPVLRSPSSSSSVSSPSPSSLSSSSSSASFSASPSPSAAPRPNTAPPPSAARPAKPVTAAERDFGSGGAPAGVWFSPNPPRQTLARDQKELNSDFKTDPKAGAFANRQTDSKTAALPPPQMPKGECDEAERTAYERVDIGLFVRCAQSVCEEKQIRLAAWRPPELSASPGYISHEKLCQLTALCANTREAKCRVLPTGLLIVNGFKGQLEVGIASADMRSAARVLTINSELGVSSDEDDNVAGRDSSSFRRMTATLTRLNALHGFHAVFMITPDTFHRVNAMNETDQIKVLKNELLLERNQYGSSLVIIDLDSIMLVRDDQGHVLNESLWKTLITVAKREGVSEKHMVAVMSSDPRLIRRLKTELSWPKSEEGKAKEKSDARERRCGKCFKMYKEADNGKDTKNCVSHGTYGALIDPNYTAAPRLWSFERFLTTPPKDRVRAEPIPYRCCDFVLGLSEAEGLMHGHEHGRHEPLQWEAPIYLSRFGFPAPRGDDDGAPASVRCNLCNALYPVTSFNDHVWRCVITDSPWSDAETVCPFAARGRCALPKIARSGLVPHILTYHVTEAPLL